MVDDWIWTLVNDQNQASRSKGMREEGKRRGWGAISGTLVGNMFTPAESAVG